LVLITSLYCLNINAVETPAPIPFAFVIERSKDANQIVYSINTQSNRKLDKNHPIDIFWVKKVEGQQN